MAECCLLINFANSSDVDLAGLNFACFLLSADFFQNTSFSKYYFRNTVSVLKSYQQMTLIGIELIVNLQLTFLKKHYDFFVIKE